jgi:hypothetical protein
LKDFERLDKKSVIPSPQHPSIGNYMGCFYVSICVRWISFCTVYGVFPLENGVFHVVACATEVFMSTTVLDIKPVSPTSFNSLRKMVDLAFPGQNTAGKRGRQPNQGLIALTTAIASTLAETVKNKAEYKDCFNMMVASIDDLLLFLPVNEGESDFSYHKRVNSFVSTVVRRAVDEYSPRGNTIVMGQNKPAPRVFATFPAVFRCFRRIDRPSPH